MRNARNSTAAGLRYYVCEEVGTMPTRKPKESKLLPRPDMTKAATAPSKPCRECKATGWTGGKAGQGECQFCNGVGYLDKEPVNTLPRFVKAMDAQRARNQSKDPREYREDVLE